MNEHCFARLEPGVAHQSQVRGDPHQGQRHGLLFADRGRDRIEPTFIDGRILGERSLPAHQPLIRAPDAIAGLESPRARADCFHHARQIAANHNRQRQGHSHGAGADVGVDRIDVHRADLHQHLCARGARRGQLAVANVFRRTSLLDEGGLHGEFVIRSSGLGFRLRAAGCTPAELVPLQSRSSRLRRTPRGPALRRALDCRAAQRKADDHHRQTNSSKNARHLSPLVPGGQGRAGVLDRLHFAIGQRSLHAQLHAAPTKPNSRRRDGLEVDRFGAGSHECLLARLRLRQIKHDQRERRQDENRRARGTPSLVANPTAQAPASRQCRLAAPAPARRAAWARPAPVRKCTAHARPPACCSPAASGRIRKARGIGTWAE